MALNALRRQGLDWSNLSMKQITLITLTVQNSALILIMHYSRTMPLVDGHRYFASTAVFLNEVLKLALSLTMALYTIANDPRTPDTSTAAGLFGELAKAVFAGDSWKLGIPAMLYTLQNSLQYVAVGHLDAATFQVTYQLKILTTALLSVVLLGRILSPTQWLSLVLLMLGVALVQLPTGSAAHSAVLSIKDLKNGASFRVARNIWDLKALGSVAAGQLAKRSATYEGIDKDFEAANPNIHPLAGVVAVLLGCFTSGLAGVYFEKILKEAKSEKRVSVWVRNVQLSFYSLWPSLFIGVLLKDGEQISRLGFFAGYNWVVWAAIFVQALGGVLVALVINYADNIAKNFATSISIILSFFASVFFFDFQITSLYLIGTITVLGATYLYSLSGERAWSKKKPPPPPINVSNFEKKPQRDTEPGYFDLESLPTPARSPALRSGALSTSRPGTPTFDRRHLRNKSSESLLMMSKRER